MFKNMKIGTRLILGFSLLVLLLIGLAASGYWGVHAVSGMTLRALQIDGNIAEHSARARANILGLRRFEKDLYLNIGSPEKEAEYLKKWQEQREHLLARIDDLDKVAVTQEDKNITKAMRTEFSHYETGFNKVHNLLLAGKIKNPYEANAAISQYKDEIHKMETTAQDFATEGNKRMDAVEPLVKSTASRTTIIMMTFMVVAIGLSIGISIPLTRSITKPLVEIAGVSKKIAEGDINQEVNVSRRDEIGLLAKSFQEMIAYLQSMAQVAGEIAQGDLSSEVTPKSERDILGNAFKGMSLELRNIITEIKVGSEQIGSSSIEIAGTSEQAARNNEATVAAVDETTASMHEMSVNIQSVAKNTQSQAASVAQTSASIEQMTASIQRVAATGQQLVELSQRVKQAVNMGLESVDKSIKGTQEINQAIAGASDTINILGSRSEEIGKIVDVIDDIAEQTNLLALNAAIEAARAGEQGLGFAVVAEEVRKLAERSAKSTREIADLINSIQKESKEAVKLMDKSTLTVEKGVELNRMVSESFRKIEENVAETDRYSKELGAATQEQSSGSQQIEKAAEKLQELTKEIASAAEEQASGAEQIVKAMEKLRAMGHENASGTVQLASSAEELRAQAEKFQRIVGQFVLDENGKGGGAAGSKWTPAPVITAKPVDDGNGKKNRYAEKKLAPARS